MSIINEALKKVEKDKHISHNRPANILRKVDQVKTEIKRFVLKKWLIWLGTGVICISGILLILNSLKRPVSSVIPAPSKETEITPAAIQNIQLFKKKAERIPTRISDFHLSGILYDSQHSLAIINNRIMAEGTSLYGAKLLKIQPDYVLLSLKGKEFRLKIK